MKKSETDVVDHSSLRLKSQAAHDVRPGVHCMNSADDIWIDFDKLSEPDYHVELFTTTKPPSIKKSMIVHIGIDGLAAACIAIANQYEGDIYAVGSDNIDIPTMIDPYYFVTIVDMSLSREALSKRRMSHWFDAYDHHARNSFLNAYEGCYMDPRLCACKQYYNHNQDFISKNETLEHFIELIDVIDRWQFDNPLFDEAKDLFNLFMAMTKNVRFFNRKLIYSKGVVTAPRFTQFINSMVRKLKKKDLTYTPAELELIQKENEQLESDYLETLKTLQFRIDDRQRIFVLCKAIGNISLVSNILLKRHTDIKYILLYKELSKKTIQISARSRSIDIDMNELEGLEGHPLAAGAYMDSEFVLGFIENKNAYLATVKHTSTKAPPMKVRRTRGAPPSQLKRRLTRNQKE